MDKQHALDELIANYTSKDVIKAKAVIDYLLEIDSGERKRILLELSKWDDHFAIPVLAYLCYKHPAFVEDHSAIRSMLVERAIANPSQILKHLVSIVPETSVYVDLVKKTRLKEALPRIRQFLIQSDDTGVIKSSIQTLAAFGDTNAIDGIAEYLASNDDELQLAAMNALGEIGTEKSLSLLYAVLEQYPKMREAVLNLLAEVQSEAAIHMLNKTLTSPDAETRTLGKTRLAQLGAKAVPVLTANLSIDHPDLQIHTLNILLEIGDESSVKAVRNLLNTEPEDDNVRFAAFETLAHLPSLKGDYLLATGLTDRDDAIRLAAAKAIDKNLDPVLTGGIKNMIKTEDAEAVRVSKAIVDAEAGELYVALLELPFFHRITTEYIATRVHPAVRRFFLQTLREKDLSQTADQIEQRAEDAGESAQRKQICAVDDSVMILSVYRRVLNELGFEPVLFEFPEECLFWLAENQAVALFTDLNMPKMTGIELSRRVREQYDDATLPIIMVTTQQEGKDNRELEAAGINRVLNKPFDTESLGRILVDLNIANADK